MSLKILFCLVILVCVCAPALGQIYPPPDGEISQEYDRFKDATVLSLFNVGVFEKEYPSDYQRIYLALVAQFSSPRPASKPEQVGLILTSWSLFNNRYIGTSELCFIVDSVRKPCLEMKPVSRREINGKFVVSMGTWIDYDTISRVAHGVNVEARWGDVEFTIEGNPQKKIDEFLRKAVP